MLGAATRIVRAAEMPVTVDAEAGYGMEPASLVDGLQTIGAAGCNHEDTATGLETSALQASMPSGLPQSGRPRLRRATRWS